jgi:4-alpha-glucanotransferase
LSVDFFNAPETTVNNWSKRLEAKLNDMKEKAAIKTD